MMGHADCNRYLFHWLSCEALAKFDLSGKLTPSWRHWVLDEGRHVRGTSTCEEPMLWSPDEEKEREPCLVLDRSTLTYPVHPLFSAEAFHVTRAVAAARRKKGDVQSVIDRAFASRRSMFSTSDEYFVEGPLSWENVAALGYEFLGTPSCEAMKAKADEIAGRRGIPVIDMTGWEVSSPGYRETDEIVEEARKAGMDRSPSHDGDFSL